MHTFDTRGSKASHCLERAWAALQTILPGLPSVVCVILPAGARGRFGQFAPYCWKSTAPHQTHELAVNPGLFQRAEDLLVVLLHEGAHALLEHSANRGFSHSPYYHNKFFAKKCRELGLACVFTNTRYGWSHTQWSRVTDIPSRYAPVLTILKEGLPLGTAPQRIPRLPPKLPPPSGHTRLVCTCPDHFHRTVYVKASVLQQGRIRCELCGSLFAIPSTSATSQLVDPLLRARGR